MKIDQKAGVEKNLLRSNRFEAPVIKAKKKKH
jgi:hypothetical protein